MRVILFFVVLTVANAAPQEGYNYQFGSSVGNELTEDQYQLLQQYTHQQLNQPNQQQLNLHQALETSQQQQQQQVQLSPESAVHEQQPVVIIKSQEQPSKAAQKQKEPHYQTDLSYQGPETQQYNKEFFYLSAPEDDFETEQNIEKHLESMRKNIRVLFIKAPENNAYANAALQLAKQSLDQQTVVYVLSKKHDAADLANKLQQVRNSVQTKPDVIFVKYKTPEEAEHAQRTIQSQYEALNGPNRYNHQDVVSTHDFVGSTGNRHSHKAYIDPRKSSSNTAAEDPSPAYLPAAPTKL